MPYSLYLQVFWDQILSVETKKPQTNKKQKQQQKEERNKQNTWGIFDSE